jgi:hypothetical protein
MRYCRRRNPGFIVEAFGSVVIAEPFFDAPKCARQKRHFHESLLISVD